MLDVISVYDEALAEKKAFVMKLPPQRFYFAAITFGILSLGCLFLLKKNPVIETKNPDPLPAQSDEILLKPGDELTMREVLELATESLDYLSQNVTDYTARFEKIEASSDGNPPELTEMLLKVQTRFRDGQTEAPRRLYLRFTKPESVTGREVIWRQDKYDGLMAVHEVGFLLNLSTLWLDPEGLIAMQGQRHPISELGIVKLTEQLIERGGRDLENPNISISVDHNFVFDGRKSKLITVLRQQPIKDEDDYQRAEIVVDSVNNLVVAFRSYALEEAGTDPPRLLESYAYHDLEINVGLSETDFDTSNKQYNFP